MSNQTEHAIIAEFHLDKNGRYELFSVTTQEEDCLGTQGYDVDWCESTQEYAYHCSSAGFRPPLEIGGIYWSLRPEDVMEKPSELANRSARLRNKTRRLSELPAEFIDANGGDLFAWLENNCRESSVEYCSACKSYILTADTDYPCDHIWWCEEVACWSTPSERYKDCTCEECAPAVLEK